MHVIAAKAVALKEAATDEFKSYQRHVVANARKLAETIGAIDGLRIVSGGTDNHLMLVDLQGKKLTGKAVEAALDKAGLTVNKNAIPFDPEKPFVTSGIRIGTPAVTTRGLTEENMAQIGQWVGRVIDNLDDAATLATVRAEVRALCERFPLYGH